MRDRAISTLQPIGRSEGGKTSGKHTKENRDCNGQVETDHPFKKIDITFDFGNACLVICHRSGSRSRLGFPGSSFN
jgi:hypothetical protein